MEKETVESNNLDAAPLQPLSTRLRELSMPCALRYYWPYADQAWQHCLQHLVPFANKSGRFTTAFVNARRAEIKTFSELPTNSVRTSISKQTRLLLKSNRQIVVEEGRRLGIAINYAYRATPEVAATQRQAAGLDDLLAATNSDWAAVATFIVTATNYLTANLTALVDAGALNEDFETNFTTVGSAFNSVWNTFRAERKMANNGTQAVVDGVKTVKAELIPMMELGYSIFKFEPNTRKLFTQVDLLEQVRGGHPGGIKGHVNWADNNKPIGNIFVEVLNEEGKTAITDNKGRYLIILAAGTYTVRFSGIDIQPFEQSVTVEPGVKRRTNVLLSRAEIAPMDLNNSSVTSLGHQLSAAVNELQADTESATLDEVENE